MTFAQDERQALCADALAAGPDAPTMCEGWTVTDLMAHLHARENDPVAALSVLVPAFKDLAAKRRRELMSTYGFEGVVAQVADGPKRTSVFGLPGLDARANGVEMYVHHEDIRRAADPVPPARELDQAIEDDLWGKLGMARLTFRKSPVGVVLERTDRPDQTRRAKAGTRTVTLVGLPSELLLYVFGRRTVADVRVIGDPDSIAAFEATKVGV